jgi:hypothetical protein
MKAKWTMVLILAFALLVLPGAVYATEVEEPEIDLYDAGYQEGTGFYSEYPDFNDGEEAYDEFLDLVLADDYETSNTEILTESDFIDGFEDGYEDAQLGNVDLNFAKELGESEGRTAALNDFYQGRNADFEDAMPSDRTILRDYDLDRMDDVFQEAFLLEFKDAFKLGYNEAYEEALLGPVLDNMEEGLKNGQAAGELEGQTSAQRDYLLNNRMDYERDILSSKGIIDRYKLKLASAEYSDAFVEGFRSEYQIAYNKMFRDLSGSQAVNKTVSAFITAKGGELTANAVFDGIDDPGIMVSIEPGTFYLPTHLTIDTMNTEYYQLGPSVRASELYRVLLDNPANTIDKTKYVTLSFPYYGNSNKGGIYKFIDERWYYMPSVVSDGMISTRVAPHTLANRDSVYAVFMDDSIRILTDVRDHWAKDEIETMVRRGIILGYPGSTPLDGTFRPTQNITRAEFLILLSRIENWVLPNYVARATYFNDYLTFSTYDRIISYGLNNGYILGYTDRTFRPHNPISYYEVELIMGRVLRDYSFRWNSVATQMMYEKAYKSPSFVDLNRKITRAEVAYMLYTLNEWRY